MTLSTNQIAIMDVHILMSIVNMKLRDEFSSLSSLCARFELNEQLLIDRLAKAGFSYVSAQNQFRNTVS